MFCKLERLDETSFLCRDDARDHTTRGILLLPNFGWLPMLLLLVWMPRGNRFFEEGRLVN